MGKVDGFQTWPRLSYLSARNTLLLQCITCPLPFCMKKTADCMVMTYSNTTGGVYVMSLIHKKSLPSSNQSETYMYNLNVSVHKNSELCVVLHVYTLSINIIFIFLNVSSLTETVLILLVPCYKCSPSGPNFFKNHFLKIMQKQIITFTVKYYI